MSSKFNFNRLAMAVVVAMSTLMGQGKASAAYACEDAFADTKEFQVKQLEINGKQIEYRSVKMNNTASDMDIAASKHDILIGLSEGGHAYLVGEGLRLDGNLYRHKTKVNDEPHLSRGVVIRIKAVDLDRAIIQGYHDTKTLTCAKTMCNALDKSAGLYIGTKDKTFLSPYTVLRTILKDGIVDARGNKVPFEIYYLGREDLPATMVQMKKNTAELRNAVLAPLIPVAVMTPLLSALVISLFNDND